MEPKYVTFEQGKWLFEKDYPPTARCFNEEGKECTVSVVVRRITESTYYPRPEQHQVVEWLRVNHNIDLQPICNYGQLGRTYRMGIIFINKEGEVDTVFLRPIDAPFKFIEFNTPQEAYSAAFDHIEDNELI